MSIATTTMEELARRLVALETARHSSSDLSIEGAVRVCDKLRISITRYTGNGGYASLLSRSIALAKVKAPSLGKVEIQPDGSLRYPTDVDPALTAENAGMVLVATLLGLLNTLIGEELTMTLVRRA